MEASSTFVAVIAGTAAFDHHVCTWTWIKTGCDRRHVGVGCAVMGIPKGSLSLQTCVTQLMDNSSPSLDTIKMQVYFGMNYSTRGNLCPATPPWATPTPPWATPTPNRISISPHLTSGQDALRSKGLATPLKSRLLP